MNETRRAPGEATAAAVLIARIERMPHTAWHVQARLIVGSATFFDGFDAISIAYVLPVLITQWKLLPSQIGLLISAGYIGQIFGAILFGWLADRIGRIPSLVASLGVFAVASFACAAAWNYDSLFTLRTLQGIGLGGEVPVAAAYISEMTKSRGRGFFFLLYQAIFAFGLMAASLIGLWLVPRFGWQSMFLIGGLPALLTFPIRRLLPESARWLVGKGRLADAERVMHRLEEDTERRGIALPPLVLAAVTDPSEAQSSWTELFKGIYLGRTLVVWVIWFSTYFVNYGIATWLPTLYRTVFKVDVTTALQYSVISQVAGLIAACSVAFLFDRFSRRVWFGLAFVFAAGPLFVLWLNGAPTASSVIIYATIGYFWIVMNSPACYLYTTEIYPTRIRALGASVASAWVRIGSAIGPAAVGFMLSGFGLGAVFLMFGIVALFGAAVAGAFATESRERVLEDISP